MSTPDNLITAAQHLLEASKILSAFTEHKTYSTSLLVMADVIASSCPILEEIPIVESDTGGIALEEGVFTTPATESIEDVKKKVKDLMLQFNK